MDWRRFKALPYPGGTRSWPADFLTEWRYIHDELNTATDELEQLADEDD